MGNQRKWSSLLGWAIFGLVLAGGPIINVIQSVFGVQLPSYTLPVVIALLMLTSAVASVGRVARGDQRNVPPLPPAVAGTSLPRFGSSPNQMPPLTAPAPPVMPFPADAVPSANERSKELKAPRFEPIINLPLILLGAVGLIVLGLAALLIFIQP